MRPPVANEPYDGSYDATAFGAPCILQNLSDYSSTGLEPSAAALLKQFLGGFSFSGDSEDCMCIYHTLERFTLSTCLHRSYRQRLDPRKRHFRRETPGPLRTFIGLILGTCTDVRAVHLRQ